jgi:hypothetical protein
MAIDYRELLIKYMSVVADHEGVTFVPDHFFDFLKQRFDLTPEEVSALIEADEESRDRWRALGGPEE